MKTTSLLYYLLFARSNPSLDKHRWKSSPSRVFGLHQQTLPTNTSLAKGSAGGAHALLSPSHGPTSPVHHSDPSREHKVPAAGRAGAGEPVHRRWRSSHILSGFNRLCPVPLPLRCCRCSSLMLGFSSGDGSSPTAEWDALLGDHLSTGDKVSQVFWQSKHIISWVVGTNKSGGGPTMKSTTITYLYGWE